MRRLPEFSEEIRSRPDYRSVSVSCRAMVRNIGDETALMAHKKHNVVRALWMEKIQRGMAEQMPEKRRSAGLIIFDDLEQDQIAQKMAVVDAEYGDPLRVAVVNLDRDLRRALAPVLATLAARGVLVERGLDHVDIEVRRVAAEPGEIGKPLQSSAPSRVDRLKALLGLSAPAAPARTETVLVAEFNPTLHGPRDEVLSAAEEIRAAVSACAPLGHFTALEKPSVYAIDLDERRAWQQKDAAFRAAVDSVRDRLDPLEFPKGCTHEEHRALCERGAIIVNAALAASGQPYTMTVIEYDAVCRRMRMEAEDALLRAAILEIRADLECHGEAFDLSDDGFEKTCERCETLLEESGRLGEISPTRIDSVLMIIRDEEAEVPAPAP